MWVAESVRGLGIGRRLLHELEASARSGGSRRAPRHQPTLVEAISMYRSAGYAEVPPFNDEYFAHHWFRKELAHDV